MPRASLVAFGTAALLGAVASLPAQDEAGPSRRSKTAREIAQGVRVKSADGATAFPIMAEPIYRFEDPARTFSGGAVWAYGKTGRPAALVTIALEKRPEGGVQWVEELTSLSSGAIQADVQTPQRLWRWEPPRAGFTVAAIAPASAPGEDERKRLRQMRELALRFKAYEFWKPARAASAERYELRLLPQPVHRYRDPSAGIIDGGIFLFAYGQNPEVALVIEARMEGTAMPAWTYGLGRLAAAKLLVRLDDQEVANSERPVGPFLKSSYEALALPADGQEE
ncbi:MAG: hypothetical protein P4L84_27150 [Isosphaeraceae bacterium]|nr:hypothetical protein [Isosphaeraceae bacterium]